MSDTPIVDKAKGHYDASGCWRFKDDGDSVPVELAEQLERDRARLIEALNEYVLADEFGNGPAPGNECPRLRRARAVLSSLEAK